MKHGFREPKMTLHKHTVRWLAWLDNIELTWKQSTTLIRHRKAGMTCWRRKDTLLVRTAACVTQLAGCHVLEGGGMLQCRHSKHMPIHVSEA